MNDVRTIALQQGTRPDELPPSATRTSSRTAEEFAGPSERLRRTDHDRTAAASERETIV